MCARAAVLVANRMGHLHLRQSRPSSLYLHVLVCRRHKLSMVATISRSPTVTYRPKVLYWSFTEIQWREMASRGDSRKVGKT